MCLSVVCTDRVHLCYLQMQANFAVFDLFKVKAVVYVGFVLERKPKNHGLGFSLENGTMW